MPVLNLKIIYLHRRFKYFMLYKFKNNLFSIYIDEYITCPQISSVLKSLTIDKERMTGYCDFLTISNL